MYTFILGFAAGILASAAVKKINRMRLSVKKRIDTYNAVNAYCDRRAHKNALRAQHNDNMRQIGGC